MLRSAVVVAIAVAACAPDHGTPHTQSAPKTDLVGALRTTTPRSSRIANYKLEARLDAAKHQIAGSETLSWTNTGQSPVDMLPFHLYLNGFKNEQSLLWKSSRGVARLARAGETWGWIQIDSIKIAGTELVGKLRKPASAGTDESVVELPLAEPLAPGATIEVQIKFTDQLPEVWARTGFRGEFHMVGQWFPKVGVRTGPPGAEHWECNAFHIDTEFFADFGTYDVALTVPNTETVAATGVLTNAVDLENGMRTLTYHAEDVHDFAWMADPFMKVITGKAKVEDGTVEVRVYYRPEQEDFAKRHLEAAVGAIEKFSAAFGAYPWSIMSVVDPPVDAALAAGGMEYPTLVTTLGDSVLFRPGIRLPEYVTVHEVGHNWFQGMLASNEADEAWLDEGVNEWADYNVMAELYGARASGIDWMGWQADVAMFMRALADGVGNMPSPIATSASAFVDDANYGDASYRATARALATLEHAVGAQRFAKAMKVYAKTFAFKHPTGRDLFQTLSTELGQDLSWYFGPVFHEVGQLELALRSASCRRAHPVRGVFGEGTARRVIGEVDTPDAGYVCEVVVQNTGRFHVPVEIELRFADGSTQRLVWDDKGMGNWERFVVERSSELVEVWLDPEGKISLDSPIQHRYRVEGDGSAALRAGAWFGSFAQTLMQIVGP